MAVARMPSAVGVRLTLPAELKALIAKDPSVDAQSYWIDGLGWDLDGIRSDLQVETGRTARVSLGASAKARGPGPQLQTSRPAIAKTFSGLLSVAQAKAAATGSSMLAMPRQRMPPPPSASGVGRAGGVTGGPMGARPAGAANRQPARVNAGGVATNRPGQQQDERIHFDNEGRPFDMQQVVVNVANVGINFGKKFAADGKFHWEGIRRCVKHLTQELRLKVICVIYENWKGNDNVDYPQMVSGVPKDIRDMCQSIEETPRATGKHQKSADDEMTIKCTYRRNCRMLDNDNYRDWLRVMRNEKMRAWLEHSQERIHMKYYFDSGLGCFETLDGNAERGASEERDGGGKGGGPSVRPTEERNGGGKGGGKRSSQDGATSCVTPPDSFLDQSGGYQTPLAQVAYPRGRVPTIEPFRLEAAVSRGPRPEKVAASGQTAVSTVSALNEKHEGWTPVCAAAAEGNFEMVRALLEKGADPNIANLQGAHPLFYAVDKWNMRLVRILLQYGAQPAITRGPFAEPLTTCARRRLGEGTRAATRAMTHQQLLADLGVDVSDLLATVAAPPKPRPPAPTVLDLDDPPTSSAASGPPQPKRSRTSVADPTSAVAAHSGAPRPSRNREPSGLSRSPSHLASSSAGARTHQPSRPRTSSAGAESSHFGASARSSGTMLAPEVLPPSAEVPGPRKRKPAEAPAQPKARETKEVRQRRLQELNERVSRINGTSVDLEIGSPKAAAVAAAAPAWAVAEDPYM